MIKKGGGFLLCSALALIGFSQATPLDKFEVDFDRCRDDRFSTNQAISRFNGIFFGDFDTYDSLGSLGPLAVKGDFKAPNYVVNANHDVSCSRTRSYPSYGLVVGGNVDTKNTLVHGSAYVNGGGTLDEIVIKEAGCQVYNDKKTGIFNFTSVEEDIILASQEFAKLEPTAVLTNSAAFTKLAGNSMDHYEVLTFGSCGQAVCSGFTNEQSEPESIFFGQGDWKGMKQATNQTRTYVLNVPVKNGATVTLDTNHPSANLNTCNTIYNFYPVDSNGNPMPNGEFTLHRKTGGNLEGLVLAPRGHIIDGSVGNFAGSVIGLDYTWEVPTEGAELLDYKAGGGKCDSFSGCLPFFLPPGISRSFSRSTTTTQTTTLATSKTTTTTEIDIDTATDTFTDTVTETVTAPNQVATVTEERVFLQEQNVTTVTEQVGVVTDTVTLIQEAPTPETITIIQEATTIIRDGTTITQDGTTITQDGTTITQDGGAIIEFIGVQDTITIVQGPDTVYVVQQDPEILTVSGEVLIIPGENITFTQVPDDYVVDVYTTTYTESGSTFVSSYTTTRHVHHVRAIMTVLGEANTFETTIYGTEFVPEATTVTETVVEWQPPRKEHYHKGSDKECYEDDEDKDNDDDDDDDDNDYEDDDDH